MEQDRRYRILVLLQRADRPRHYEFYCFNCQYKVCELAGTDVVALQDIVDVSSHELVGVTCDGRYQGGKCGMKYYFSLSDKPQKSSVRVTTTHVRLDISGKPQ